MRTITIGVDLAKQVFSVCSVDAAGRVQHRRDLRREAFRQWLPSVPAGTIVAMAACSRAHHWARRCQDSGLLAEIGVMVAQSDVALRRTLADLDSLSLPASLVGLLGDGDAH